ncbi:MAG: C-GCAxxG-C-C family protein [Planctomycetota bacterium]|jgi:C_GCAxxG_C_C family probable redox protein
MEKVERAVWYFEHGFNCAQAVVGAYCEQFGLKLETALKLACGFGGGMRMGQTCGVVTGAFMVLGLKYGQSEAENRGAKEKTYELVRQFVEKFESRNGSIMCKELLGCDISTPDGMKTARDRDFFVSFCPRMIRDAGEILEQMLSESP